MQISLMVAQNDCSQFVISGAWALLRDETFSSGRGREGTLPPIPVDKAGVLEDATPSINVELLRVDPPSAPPARTSLSSPLILCRT